MRKSLLRCVSPPHFGHGAPDFLLHIGAACFSCAFSSLLDRASARLASTSFANSSSDFAAALRALWARFLSMPASASVGRGSCLGGFFDNPPFVGRPLPA